MSVMREMSVESAVGFINSSVVGCTGTSKPGEESSDGSSTGGDTIPGDVAAGIAVQSVGQSMAIAVQDATDMLRNVSTVATTAMGVAMAKWIETPEMVLYKEIIQTAQGLISQATQDFLAIGQDSGTILTSFPQGSLPPPPDPADP